MALALLFGDDDSVMYLDAVTNFSKRRSSSISNHPIDKSSFITDHVSKDNPVFSIRGIVSSADFNTTFTRPVELIEGGENNPPIDTEYNQPINGAEISDSSSILDYLPGSVQQLLGSGSSPEVSVDVFQGFSHQIARARIEQAWDKSELITILDYDYDITTGRSVSVRIHKDCLIDNYQDVEDVDTGDSLVFNITFKKIRFAFIKEVDVEINQQQTSSEVSDEASSESNQGDQTAVGESPEDQSIFDRDYRPEALSIIFGS